jgi:hypothetical protein
VTARLLAVSIDDVLQIVFLSMNAFTLQSRSMVGVNVSTKGMLV